MSLLTVSVTTRTARMILVCLVGWLARCLAGWFVCLFCVCLFVVGVWFCLLLFLLLAFAFFSICLFVCFLSCLRLNFLVAVVNALHTKTHSSKEFSFENVYV